MIGSSATVAHSAELIGGPGGFDSRTDRVSSCGTRFADGPGSLLQAGSGSS
jgi:hypothetical protein